MNERRRQIGIGLTGLILWAMSLPWVVQIVQFGLARGTGSAMDMLVVAAMIAMSVSVLAWICQLCLPGRVGRLRWWLIGVLLGLAVYGWISVNVLMAPEKVFDGMPLWQVAVMTLGPVGLTGWLLLSLPYYWGLFRR
ncbi:hypothetical protein [Sulfurivirga sp.]|uniref:hypothetical protein n=1 Tax=Sulfurivirga sp. TaxID=2614236 RepID=UPI0025F93C0D|nr:hypothetical protein [Sulfurivirga sp.]